MLGATTLRSKPNSMGFLYTLPVRCHSQRFGGNQVFLLSTEGLDSRFRGNDTWEMLILVFLIFQHFLSILNSEETILLVCLPGEIGRRARLRTLWEKSRRGSNPLGGIRAVKGCYINKFVPRFLSACPSSSTAERIHGKDQTRVRLSSRA